MDAVYTGADAPSSSRQTLLTPTMGAAALEYASALEWSVLPVKERGKSPLTAHGVHDASCNPRIVANWWSEYPNANIGLACGPSGRVALDFDVSSSEFKGGQLLQRLLADHPTVASYTGGGGYHLFYKMPDGVTLGNGTGRLPRGVDVRGAGGYVVLPPSIHASGQPYRWMEGRSPDEYTTEPLPAFVMEMLRPSHAKGETIGPDSRSADASTDVEGVRSALAGLSPARCDDYESWLEVGMALSELASDGLALWEEWSRSSPKYREGVCAEKWRTFSPSGGIGLGSLFHWAREDGWKEDRGRSLAIEAWKASPNGAAGDGSKAESTTDRLYALAKETVVPFVTPEGRTFAFVQGESATRCVRFCRREVLTPLVRRFRNVFGRMPSGQARDDVMALLEADAFERVEHAHVRVAGQGDRVYLDLGSTSGAAVEVDTWGWRIISQAPVAFWRPQASLPLPEPVPCTEPWRLRRFLNIEESQWLLVAAWTVAALYPSGPYPVLAIIGEQGTAKSTTLRVLKALIDPAHAGVRGQPADLRDLSVAASNSRLLAFDNLSGLRADISDALCRMSTGGGFATRKMYSDDEEFLVDMLRPVALNGIGDVLNRADLLDRTLLITPPVIPEERRRDETSFWAEFESERPAILGAFLSALSTALSRMPEVRLTRLPRMADFARIATAAEPALRRPGDGSFLAAYNENRDDVFAAALEGSPFAEALIALAAEGLWQGSAQELLALLAQRECEATRRSRAWPAAPNKVKGRLEQDQPLLRRAGVEVRYGRIRGRSDILVFRADASNRGADGFPAGEVQL